jgi:hypothetical protein
MKLRTIALSLVLMAASAFAADIDGKWAGNLDFGGNTVPISFSFKADGAKLEGSSTGPDGSEIKFTDGKVDGNKISFSQTIDFGMPITIAYTGVLSGGELKLHADFAGMPLDFVLKKG